jgi:hypothetical protein
MSDALVVTFDTEPDATIASGIRIRSEVSTRSALHNLSFNRYGIEF